METYKYEYNRVWGVVKAEDTQTGSTREVAFLQGEEADKLDDELEKAKTQQQKQDILSQYDYC